MVFYVVVGCADISPPPGAWMTRDGDITELGCHSGKLAWTLECVGNHWVGAVGNCGEGICFNSNPKKNKILY